MRLAATILLLALPFAGPAQAQEEADMAGPGYFAFSEPSPLSCLLSLFPPLLIERGSRLKEFIRSDEFAGVRERYGDSRAVDAIFVRSMQLTDNNTGISLLLSAAAVFDHDVVGVRIPLFSMAFPLTSESVDDFTLRRDRLPSHFYSDSPATAAGDRDKLQHFFGSAFLTFTSESPGTAERFGDFVEQGEEAFIIGGVLDERDFRANRQGQLFGAALLDDNRRYPSDYLRPAVASPPPGDLSSFPGAWPCEQY